MEWKEILIEGAKQIVSKGVTLVATALIAQGGAQTVYQYAVGLIGGIVPPEVKIAAGLLVIGTSYAVWTEAVVPIVEKVFMQLQGQAPKAKGYAPMKSRFKLF